MRMNAFLGQHYLPMDSPECDWLANIDTGSHYLRIRFGDRLTRKLGCTPKPPKFLAIANNQ
jgi:hypothetical protein